MMATYDIFLMIIVSTMVKRTGHSMQGYDRAAPYISYEELNIECNSSHGIDQ